jgi:hypothetical protein
LQKRLNSNTSRNLSDYVFPNVFRLYFTSQKLIGGKETTNVEKAPKTSSYLFLIDKKFIMEVVTIMLKAYWHIAEKN